MGFLHASLFCIDDFNLFRLRLFSLLGFRGGIRCYTSDVKVFSLIYELSHVKYQGSIFLIILLLVKERKLIFSFVGGEAGSMN